MSARSTDFAEWLKRPGLHVCHPPPKTSPSNSSSRLLPARYFPFTTCDLWEGSTTSPAGHLRRKRHPHPAPPPSPACLRASAPAAASAPDILKCLSQLLAIGPCSPACASARIELCFLMPATELCSVPAVSVASAKPAVVLYAVGTSPAITSMAATNPVNIERLRAVLAAGLAARTTGRVIDSLYKKIHILIRDRT